MTQNTEQLIESLYRTTPESARPYVNIAVDILNGQREPSAFKATLHSTKEGKRSVCWLKMEADGAECETAVSTEFAEWLFVAGLAKWKES